MPIFYTSPKGTKAYPRPASEPARHEVPAESWGPPLWRRLHTGARTAATPAERLALVAEISAALPTFCSCRAHWRALLRDTPPVVATAEEFFVWTVEAHNAVRTRKAQPPLPLPEAEALYPVS